MIGALEALRLIAALGSEKYMAMICRRPEATDSFDLRRLLGLGWTQTEYVFDV